MPRNKQKRVCEFLHWLLITMGGQLKPRHPDTKHRTIEEWKEYIEGGESEESNIIK